MTDQFIDSTFTLLIIVLIAHLFGLSAFGAEGRSEGTELPLIDQREYKNLKTATFALGCFWCGDARYGTIPGVIRTRVGYTGGEKENPTYHDLGDHTESIQVDFNPEVISYQELVDIFWETHNPYSTSYSIQYANILFYHDNWQKTIAETTKQQLVEGTNRKVHTQIRPIEKFYPAEPYHQKYRLRQNSPFIDILKDIYPNSEDLRDSTAAARLNGFLAGYGTWDQLEKLSGQLGLTKDLRDKLLKEVSLKSKTPPQVCYGKGCKKREHPSNLGS